MKKTQGCFFLAIGVCVFCMALPTVVFAELPSAGVPSPTPAPLAPNQKHLEKADPFGFVQFIAKSLEKRKKPAVSPLMPDLPISIKRCGCVQVAKTVAPHVDALGQIKDEAAFLTARHELKTFLKKSLEDLTGEVSSIQKVLDKIKGLPVPKNNSPLLKNEKTMKRLGEVEERTKEELKVLKNLKRVPHSTKRYYELAFKAIEGLPPEQQLQALNLLETQAKSVQDGPVYKFRDKVLAKIDALRKQQAVKTPAGS